MLDSSLEMSSSVSEAEFRKGSWPAWCCLLQSGGGGCELGLLGAVCNGLGGGLDVIRGGSFLVLSDTGEDESRLNGQGWDRACFKGLVVARGLQDGRIRRGLNEYESTRGKD